MVLEAYIYIYRNINVRVYPKVMTLVLGEGVIMSDMYNVH